MTEPIQIDQLIILVISSSQLSDLAQALVKQKFYFTQVNSRGGLLSDDQVSLLIGIPTAQHDALLDLVCDCCHTRRTYIPAQTESPMLQGQPVMIEALVGGAMVYTLEVDHFERF